MLANCATREPLVRWSLGSKNERKAVVFAIAARNGSTKWVSLTFRLSRSRPKGPSAGSKAMTRLSRESGRDNFARANRILSFRSPISS